jgi:cytochrome c553
MTCRIPPIVRLALAATLLGSTIAFAVDPGFVDLRRIDAVRGDADAGEAKAVVCSACHGPAGVAPVPAFPNLAGQHAEYLYWRLVEFKREARPDSPMTPQVANLDVAAMRDLAAYFASLPPAPQGADDAANQRGAALYREGDPARGTPPCQGCHGASGEGRASAADDASYRTYPKLRGQHAAYVAQRLRDFRDGKHLSSSTGRIMTPVAATLDDDAIRAVAAWIETGP